MMIIAMSIIITNRYNAEIERNQKVSIQAENKIFYVDRDNKITISFVGIEKEDEIKIDKIAEMPAFFY